MSVFLLWLSLHRSLSRTLWLNSWLFSHSAFNIFFYILWTMKDSLKRCMYHCQSYLSTVGVVGIRWVQHSRVLDKRIHFFVQDVKVTGVTQQEGPCQRESLNPGEDSIKEIAGNVETLIPPPQLHHVTAWTGEHTEDRYYLQLSVTLHCQTYHSSRICFTEEVLLTHLNWTWKTGRYSEEPPYEAAEVTGHVLESGPWNVCVWVSVLSTACAHALCLCIRNKSK